jgi:hypothetical protein
MVPAIGLFSGCDRKKNIALLQVTSRAYHRQQAPPVATTAGGVHSVLALRDDFLEKDRPADQAVAAGTDARLNGQIEVAGFVDQARDFAHGLGDVQQQGTATSDNLVLGHGRSVLLCPMGPAR